METQNPIVKDNQTPPTSTSDEATKPSIAVPSTNAQPNKTYNAKDASRLVSVQAYSIAAETEVSPPDDVEGKTSVVNSNEGKDFYGETETDEDEEFCYNMNHKNRGLMVIINNRHFHYKCERHGTERDGQSLSNLFKQFKFDLKIHNNKTAMEMRKIMEDAATNYSHVDSDCFVCVILSHGDGRGNIEGVDTCIALECLVEPMLEENCAALAGKPKIFIIQACRGTTLDEGVEFADAITNCEEKLTPYSFPIYTEPDLLFCFSTVPSYFSWRNGTKGSWFIQSLCKLVQHHANTKDLLSILTIVNREVAFEYESKHYSEIWNKKKEMPQIISTLTKDIFIKLS